jgi:hypothetical protein
MNISAFIEIRKSTNLEMITIKYIKLIKTTIYVKDTILFPHKNNPLSRAQHALWG